MKQVICPICGEKCIRNGKDKSGSQRWLCKRCRISFVHKIDNSAKQLQDFLTWLFGKGSQKEMPGEGRTFRRKTARFWDIWTLPAKIEEKRDVVYVDGIYLGRKACVLICCDDEAVLEWYLCRYEHSGAWIALMSRIAEPKLVISDGGTGFAKALKKVWGHTIHQRCVFHAFCQVKRYTTSKPQTAAGIDLYMLAKDLLHIETKEESENWTGRFIQWMREYNSFLSQMTYDETGGKRPTHERLLKAQHSLLRLVKEGNLFTYLDDTAKAEIDNIPSTTNRIEGGINAQLRSMLREHRGLSVERRIKAVFWWCYMHSPKPLSAAEILKTMPTDKSIADIYRKMNARTKLEKSIPQWGDAIVWEELHKSTNFTNRWN